MQRGSGEEYREEQFPGDLSLDGDAGLDDASDAGASLEDDETTETATREFEAGADDFVDGALPTSSEECSQDAHLANLNQHPAQLRLEEDDERDHPDRSDRLDEPAHAAHADELGDGSSGEEQQQPGKHLRRPCSAHDLVDLVEDESDGEDVEQVYDPDRQEAYGEKVQVS